MSRWRVLSLVLLLLVTGGLWAQEQVGGIEGVVKDNTGAVLPGVTVEAISMNGGSVVTVTDSTGAYRFPRLPSGRYTVKASLSGYNTATVTQVDLTLGKTASVNLVLSLGKVAESITVTAEAPLVDLTQSAKAVSIAREQIELLPKGRDFSSVVTQASGASNEGFLAGVSVDGASGLENRYVIDGIDTTNPYNGRQGQNLVTDFIEEVQVKSAGYAAEYGGSLGGVINVVTKSGTNNLSGWLNTYYTDSSWGGKERPTPYEDAPGNYFTFPKDKSTRFEPGFGVGGPIVRDRMWFFLAYNPTLVTTKRTPLSITGSRGSTVTYKETDAFYSGNIKGNVGSKFLYKVSANVSPETDKGVLPAVDNSTPADANLGITNKYPVSSYSAYADLLPSSSFYVSGRAGQFTQNQKTSGITAQSRILFLYPFAGDESNALWRPSGFSDVPAASFSGVDSDKWTRSAGALDVNYFAHGLGEHSFKAGVQAEKNKNSVSSGEFGNLFRVRWDHSYIGVNGTYGAVEVRRFRTQGGADTNALGLYIQDSWQIRPNFMLNYGVRTESEHIPNYGAKVDSTLPKWAMEWGFSDKVAPRIGFAWDVLSNQKLKVYGDYGTYYDIMKIDMARQSFGAAKWISYVYPLETLDWTTLSSGCKISQNVKDDNPCPALGTPVTRDFRKPTDPRTAIDPNLKPMENREYQVGADYLLTSRSVAGFRYVNKKLINTIEDIGYLDFATGDEVYTTGNPGKGIVAGDPPGPVPAQPEAVRDYWAAELSFDKRFSDNWSLRSSYTYSSLKGNYSGLASSDEFGRADPNIERYFDAITNAFDQNGRQVVGPLNTDRPHSIKMQGIYRSPFRTTFGVNFTWASGTPVSEEVYYNLVPFFPHGRGNLGRTPNISQTDLLITHPFSVGSHVLEASINVLNLFDSKTVTRIQNNHYRGDMTDVSGIDGSYESFFAAPFDTDAIMARGTAEGVITENPYYRRPLSYQAPRAVRVGVKFVF